MYRCDNQCCKARTTRVAEAVALAIAITVAAAVAVALYSVAVTVAIPVGPDWAILERNFWPKRANKASDADRLAVKMRIAEVTVVDRLLLSRELRPTISRMRTHTAKLLTYWTVCLMDLLRRGNKIAVYLFDVSGAFDNI